jgi:TonB family protein
LCPCQSAAQTRSDPSAKEPSPPKLTKPPKLRRFVDPDYPETAKAEGRTATVLLSISIDESGRVVNVERIGDANPEFDAAAIAAARKFEFEPAEVDERPAPVRITYRYQFVLEPALAEPEPEPEALPVRLRGRVLFRDSGTPAVSVVMALGEPPRRVVTDAEGRFDLGELEPGLYVLRISGEGITPTVVEQGLPMRDPDGVVYEVSAQISSEEIVDEIIVIRTDRLRHEAGESKVTTAEGRKVAGAIGDALNVVQNLPGVASSPAGTSGLVVWGAAPAETRVYIDNVPVPRLYHQGGFRSVIHDGLVTSVELVPGGYGPAYGRGLGGLVRVETKRGFDEGLHGELGADVIGAATALSVRPTSSPLHLAGAGSYGYLDRVLATASDDIEQVVPLSA